MSITATKDYVDRRIAELSAALSAELQDSRVRVSDTSDRVAVIEL